MRHTPLPQYPHNAATTHNMRVKTLKFIRRLRQQIKNGEAPLTGEDCERLYIHINKPPARARPSRRFWFSCLPGCYTLPRGMKVLRELALSDPGITPPEDHFNALGLVGHGRFTLTFLPEQHGKIAHVRCYVSSRGEKGPYSNIGSTTVI